MAIITNRIKSTGNKIAITKLLYVAARNLNIALFLAVSTYLLYFTDIQKIPTVLKATGDITYNGLIVYEKITMLVNHIANKLHNFQNAAAENAQLKIEIAELKRKQNEMQSIAIENLIFKKILSVVNDINYQYVTARLLSVSFNPFGCKATIGAGTNHGIEIDQIVTNGEWLVGRVIEVSDDYATIILINDSDSRIPVVTEISRERGILSGDNKKINMVYLRDDHAVQIGERILTSGDGSVYQPSIPIAKVIDIKQNAVFAQSPVNLNNTDFVNVYTKRKSVIINE